MSRSLLRRIRATLRALSPVADLWALTLGRTAADAADAAMTDAAHARGERDEARRAYRDEVEIAYQRETSVRADYNAVLHQCELHADRIVDMAKRIEELEQVERDGLAADENASFDAEVIAEVKRELGCASGVVGEVGRLVRRLADVTRERDELRRRLDARLSDADERPAA